MYLNRKIPDSFQFPSKNEATIQTEQNVSAPIETTEKRADTPTKRDFSPLAVLLLLDLFSTQKKDG